MQSTLAASPSTSSPTSSVSYSSSTASPYHDHAFSTISTLPTAQHSQPRREDRGQGSGVAGQLYECNVPLHGLPSPLLDSYLAHGHSHGLGLGRGNDSFSAGSSLSYPLPNTPYFPGHDNGQQHHRGHRGLGEPSIGAGPSVDATMGLVANSPGVTSMSTGLGYARTVSAPISSSRSTTSCTLLGGVDVHPTYFSPTGVMISGHATPPNSASNTTATGHGTLSRVQWDVYSQSHHAEELTDYSHGWDWIGTGPVPIPLPAPTATVTSSHLRETGAFVSTSSSTAPSSSVDYEGIKPALATTSVPVNVRNLNIQTTSKDHLYPNPHPQRPQHIPLTDSNPLLLSPTAQLPTPAAMAVLLNQSNRTDGSGYPSSTGASLPPHGRGPLVQNGGAPIGRSARGVPLSNSSATSAGTNGANPLTTTPGSHPMSNTNNTSNGRGDNQSREKKHACTMCHKR
ncbi:hypothetical protein BDN72DRAFT_415083 [Pluteus cervinus]|uniref:Uncharacterized protein n=1 Tax=Pluteus cervinus TaxID=181527 RepID=A0ACD3B270_9AGAR|nr:hypothetical protein BDN72DRAFT_415083 [Pluteus cervinus]